MIVENIKIDPSILKNDEYLFRKRYLKLNYELFEHFVYNLNLSEDNFIIVNGYEYDINFSLIYFINFIYGRSGRIVKKYWPSPT